MPTPASIALAAAVGVVAGVAVVVWLQRMAYRLAEEAALPGRFVG